MGIAAGAYEMVETGEMSGARTSKGLRALVTEIGK
jgi:hypothetical protein